MTPILKEQITKKSGKWAQRTKDTDTGTKWPEQGMFDEDTYEEMRTLIKNYKSKDQSKKGQEKRQSDLEVLRKIWEEGMRLKK